MICWKMNRTKGKRMTEEVKPAPRPAPEELEDVVITQEMVASWVAYDRLQEEKAHRERQEEHELENIERELIADGVEEKEAARLAPKVRQQRITQAAVRRAEANEAYASRQVRNLF
jgi:hypothetical protein